MATLEPEGDPQRGLDRTGRFREYFSNQHPSTLRVERAGLGSGQSDRRHARATSIQGFEFLSALNARTGESSEGPRSH